MAEILPSRPSLSLEFLVKRAKKRDLKESRVSVINCLWPWILKEQNIYDMIWQNWASISFCPSMWKNAMWLHRNGTNSGRDRKRNFWMLLPWTAGSGLPSFSLPPKYSWNIEKDTKITKPPTIHQGLYSIVCQSQNCPSLPVGDQI